LTFREQTDGAFGDKRKRLNAQGFQWCQGSCCNDLHSFFTAFPKFLDSLLVDDRRGSGRADRRPEESGFFPIAFNEMNFGSGLPGKRTSNWHPRETAPRTQIGPHKGLRGQSEELERISNVARPKLGQRRRRHEIYFALPAQKYVYENIKPRFRFT